MSTAPNDILQVADVVAREKGIEREQVIVAMEEAIQKIGRTKYGQDHDIRATIDRKDGSITLQRFRGVVDEVEDPLTQLSVKEAQEIQKDVEAGSFIIDELPPISFGRMAAQTARQIISQRVREAERERQYHEFKDRVGEIISGIVKRVEFGNYIIDVGRNECLLRREESIPRENLRPGDRVRAYIMDVTQDTRGPQILLSRSHPQFMAKLFQQEVPEIYEGIIDVLAVARDPGSRAKIAVRSRDSSIDPVGSCVGIRGSRVQAVVNELQGEKIDIVPWSEDTPTFIINALSPAEITRVIYDEEGRKVQVVVPDDQLSLAIGRRGQNVRLASLLTGLDVSITSETENTAHRTEQTKQNIQNLIDALDIDEVIAHLLIAEGYESIADIAEVSTEELLSIHGFEEDLVRELQKRSNEALEKRAKEVQKELKDLSLDKSLLKFEGLTPEMLLKLGKAGCKSLDDFADLSNDELVEIIGEGILAEEETNDLIMRARAHWFEDEASAADAS